MGAKYTYSPEIAEEILRRLAAGETLRGICKDERMPDASTVVGWVVADESSTHGCPLPGFAKRYARARSEGLDVIAEQMVEIADDDTDDPQSRRVRVDTRKWLLSKLRPDKYGDRTAFDIGGQKDAPPVQVQVNFLPTQEK